MSDKLDAINGARLSPDLQQQYLDAMGIQGWQSRRAVDQYALPQSHSEAENIDVPGIAEPKPEDTTTTTSDHSDWELLQQNISSCTACELHQTRKAAVVGEGNQSARFMFISTAPSMQAETAQGLLTKEASQLFTNMLKAINISREQIYFTGLLKCQLGTEQKARTTSLLCCETYLNTQIELIKPELIVVLGETAAQHLLVSKKPIDDLRQKVYQYQSTAVMVMPHPDELLAQPENKRKAWHDLLKLQQEYNA